MRLVMTLLVRDEVDCLGAMLDAHRALGVDFVIATDNDSRDGTRELLSGCERAGWLRLIDEPDDDYAQARWVTRMARLAACEHDADWVIHADADECWWPREGDLRSTLAAVPAAVSMVGAHRYNFVIRPPAGGREPFQELMRWRRTEPVTDDGARMAIKVCHRADPDVEVAMGNHGVSGLPGEVLDDGRIDILHYPLRTYRQYDNKITRGAAALARNPDFGPEIGYHWRRAQDLRNSGELPERWAGWMFDDDRLAAAIAAGEVVEDTRLRDLLRTLRGVDPTGDPSRC